MKITYQSGFGNTFSTEAVKGALPAGQNSPQRAPKGLYTEVLSGTSFTAPRAENLSSWLYRLRPSAMHAPYKRNADGEMMFVPQQGAIALFTELGKLEVAPGEIAVVPRGLKLKISFEKPVRGYLCENYGAHFRLPELGPIGSQGLAQRRDFLAPVAAFEDKAGKCQVVAKFLGNLWASEFDRSPLDVVAWHGNCAPCQYDLARFMAINSVSFDHPDPSIFTVLTSPSGQPGVANCDFVIFPPRCQAAEHSFLPPWFHRNVMSELMGFVHGAYESKAEGCLPGGVSIHNSLQPHRPDLPHVQ